VASSLDYNCQPSFRVWRLIKDGLDK